MPCSWAEDELALAAGAAVRHGGERPVVDELPDATCELGNGEGRAQDVTPADPPVLTDRELKLEPSFEIGPAGASVLVAGTHLVEVREHDRTARLLVGGRDAQLGRLERLPSNGLLARGTVFALVALAGRGCGDSLVTGRQDRHVWVRESAPLRHGG